MMKNKIPLPPASLLLTELHLSPYQETDFIELDILVWYWYCLQQLNLRQDGTKEDFELFQEVLK